MERITHLISYKFYMDAACVELKFIDGNIIVIDTISAQNKVSDSMQIPRILNRKGGDIMIKINPLSTLYVSIDVSSKSNFVCALDFYKNRYIDSSFVSRM